MAQILIVPLDEGMTPIDEDGPLNWPIGYPHLYYFAFIINLYRIIT